MTDLPVRWGGWGILRNWGDPSNGWMILKWRGVDTPLRTMMVDESCDSMVVVKST